MDRPGTSSGRFRVNEYSFEERIRTLLEEDVDDPSEVDDDDDESVVDDSDADPDFVYDESDESSTGLSSDDEDALLDENVGESSNPITNVIAENVPLPPYFIEKMRKNELGPPNGWKSKPPPRNVHRS